jgi:O-antigen/teichoic acid export membrane protein
MNLFARNTLANFSNSFLTALLGFLVIPLLVRGLGAESYGVAAIYGTIQAAVLVFDLGWTALNGRQVALMRSNKITASHFEEYFKSVQLIFYATVAFILLVGIWLSTDIAGYLSSETFSISELSYYVIIMFVTASFRFLVALYRSTLIAHERQVEVAFANIVFTLCRHLVPVLGIYVLEFGLDFFIWWNCATALVEYVFYVRAVRPSIGFSPKAFLRGADFAPLKSVYKFSGTIALTSGLWILTTQADRILIAARFTLADFGQFVPIVTTAALLQLVAHPIATAMRPKLNIAYQHSKNKGDELLLLTVKLISSLTIPAATVLYFGSEFVVLFLFGASVGEGKISELSALLQLFVIANMVLSISATLYYYQVARGQLRWHLISAIAHPILLLPLLYVMILQFGILGAGYAALVTNLILFFFFIPVFKSLSFSRTFDWVWLLAPLMGFIWAEVYFFNMFLEKMTVLDNIQIMKLLLLAVNAVLASLLGFILVSAGSHGFKSPISVIRAEISRIK